MFFTVPHKIAYLCGVTPRLRATAIMYRLAIGRPSPQLNPNGELMFIESKIVMRAATAITLAVTTFHSFSADTREEPQLAALYLSSISTNSIVSVPLFLSARFAPAG